MSMPTEVDRSAPVIAHHEIDIRAPLRTVWELHIDVNAWPTWQTDITAAHLDGALRPGASFSWTGFGFSVNSTIYHLAEPTRVLWGGTGDGGITAIHEWIFRETPDGAHVITNESFAGAPVEADQAGMQSVLDGSLASWLAHLKAAAESRAAAAEPPGAAIAPPVMPAPDYNEAGVPSLDYVRDKIESRYGTALGATELAGELPDARAIEEQLEEREQAGKDRLEEIRRSLRGDQAP